MTDMPGGEPSEEELRAVGDTSPEPAQDVPERLQPSFQDGDPAKAGGAEIAAAMDDSQYGEPQQEA